MSILCSAFNSGAALRAISTTPGLGAVDYRVATSLLSLIEWSGTNSFAAQGEARVTVTRLAEMAEITRQHCHRVLTRLKDRLGLVVVSYQRHNGSRTASGYRFAWLDNVMREGEGDCHPSMTRGAEKQKGVSSWNDTHPKDTSSKEHIMIDDLISVEGETTAYRDGRIAETIRAAKKAVPAIAGLDVQHLWRSFCEFNRRRGHAKVPLRWLVGFLHKWHSGTGEPVRQPPQVPARTRPDTHADPAPRLPLEDAAPCPNEADELAALAPWANRWDHERDLCRRIGQDGYLQRICKAEKRYGISTFRARLVVHGAAIRAAEIAQ